MSSTVIVVVTDLDNTSHGEINVVGSPEEASNLVETLIESGYDQSRVRVFAADEFEVRVYHRPVVALTTAAEADESEQPEGSGEEADQEEGAQLTAVEAAASLLTLEGVPEPYVRNGVRFSTQFSGA